MKKTIFIAISLLISFSCQNSDSEKSFNKLTEEECRLIVYSEEAQLLKGMQDKFVQIVHQYGANGNNINNLRILALESIDDLNSNKLFLATLFGSVDEGVSFLENFSLAKKTLFNRFPSLIGISHELQFDLNESIHHFFDNLQNIHREMENRLSGYSQKNDDREMGSSPTCGSYWQQAKLLACAGLCSASTLSVGTVLCGWACWCMLCKENSSLSEVIC